VPRAAHVVLAIVVIGGAACSRERAAAAFNEAARYATEASDLDRYFAYCNAMLGRPYQQYYVRSSDAWRRSFDATTADTRIVQTPHALVPFRDFLVEYPPGFFLVALPPALLSSTPRGYGAVFGLFMIALIAIAVRVSIAIGEYIGKPVKPVALAGATAAGAVAIGMVVTQRYDAAVSMLLCAMCWAVITRRPIAGGIAAGAAVAIKIVPIVVVVVCGLYLAAEGRRRDLRIVAWSAVVTIMIVCGPAAIAAPSGVLDTLRYHRDRPLEVGSTGAALLGLWHSVDRSPSASVRMVRSFGSSNVVGRFDSIALIASLVASIVVVIGTWMWAWRRFVACRTSSPRAGVLIAASAAIVALVIATNKVGSPQYLVWLLPLGVLASFIDGRAIAVGLLFAAFLLAHVAYPILASAVEALEPWAMAVILARNLTLVAWAVTIATRAGDRRRRYSRTPGASCPVRSTYSTYDPR